MLCVVEIAQLVAARFPSESRGFFFISAEHFDLGRKTRGFIIFVAVDYTLLTSLVILALEARLGYNLDSDIFFVVYQLSKFIPL